MDHNFETPFANIESAQEYLALLAQALEEAAANAEADILGGRQTLRPHAAATLSGWYSTNWKNSNSTSKPAVVCSMTCAPFAVCFSTKEQSPLLPGVV
jgi:hypothetical protein